MTKSTDTPPRYFPRYHSDALKLPGPWDWDDGLDRDPEPFLDCLMRKSALRIPSFPSLFASEVLGEHALIGTVGEADFDGLPRNYWRVPRELQPDYVAIFEWNPASDSWVQVRIIHVEFVDQWRKERAHRTVKRHFHAILGNMEKNVHLQQFVLAVGAVIPTPGKMARSATMQRGEANKIPVLHISQLRQADFSEADQRLAIVHVLGIMMDGGGDDESVDRAAQRVFASTDPREYWMDQEALVMLAYGRPEYADRILTARNREITKMPELQQLEYKKDFLELVEDSDPVFRALAEERWGEKSKHKTHVGMLLHALRHRGIELEQEDKVALQHLPCAALPGIDAAIDAADAEDFVRRAGLR